MTDTDKLNFILRLVETAGGPCPREGVSDEYFLLKLSAWMLHLEPNATATPSDPKSFKDYLEIRRGEYTESVLDNYVAGNYSKPETQNREAKQHLLRALKAEQTKCRCEG